MKNIYLRSLFFILTTLIVFFIIYQIRNNIKKRELITIFSIAIFILIIIFFINHYTIDNFENKLDDYSSHDALFAKNSNIITNNTDKLVSNINDDKIDSNIINSDSDDLKGVLDKNKIKKMLYYSSPTSDDDFTLKKDLDEINLNMLLEKKNEAIDYYNYSKSVTDPNLYDKVQEIAIMKINQYFDLENKLKNKSVKSKLDDKKIQKCDTPDFSPKFEEIIKNIPESDNSKESRNKNNNSSNPTNINVNFNNNLLRAISNKRNINDYVMDKLI